MCRSLLVYPAIFPYCFFLRDIYFNVCPFTLPNKNVSSTRVGRNLTKFITLSLVPSTPIVCNNYSFNEMLKKKSVGVPTSLVILFISLFNS